MRVVIDRFEGDFAVCEKEDRTMLNVKRSKLPANIKESDVLIIDGDTITIDPAETAKKRGVTDKLVENLWNDND
ncbi:MAG: DUF3006 domain-containing protein [Chloroflexi bacterium]|nr:DUF3006 domain-containing protein [Chloroflexota bacterium]